MPRKVIGREMEQEDLERAMRQLEFDHGVLDICVTITRQRNGWLQVQTTCWDYNHTPATEYRTSVASITQRGPHLVTVLWKSVTALYHIVDRARAGLPRPPGY